MKNERWIKYANANTHGLYCGQKFCHFMEKKEGPITSTKDFFGNKNLPDFENQIKVYRFLP
jgi:hypothetical protein